MSASSTSRPATIDFDRLLAPLNGDSSIGESYAKLKRARTQAANLERSIEVMDREEEPAIALAMLDGHWREVRQLAEEVLAEEAKDLGAAAYLVEALLRTDGFAGLRDAFRVTRQLVEAYWEQMFPRPAEPGWKEREEVSDRLSLFASLNGRGRDGALIIPLRRQPLTEPRDNAGKGPFALWNYNLAEWLSCARQQDSAREKGVAMRAEIEQEVASSSSEFLLAVRDDLRDCLAEFNALTGALQRRSGLNTAALSLAFPSSNIESVLKECLTIAERNAEHRAPDESSTSAQIGRSSPAQTD